MKFPPSKSKLSLTVVAALLSGLLAGSTAALADEMKWRNVSHVNETHAFVLAETGGHTVGTGKGSGLGFFSDGQIATVVLGFTIDYLKSEGSFLAYETYTFADKSSLTLKRNGQTRLTKDTNGAEFVGDFQVIGGSGRYVGAQGKGTFNGRRMAPLSSGADQYFDFVADISLPARQ